MDYKTTILQTTIKTEEHLLPEIEGLNFGILSENKAVFDYTAYFEENKTQPIDYKTFMRVNRHYIESIAKAMSIKPTELFFQNTDGHILVTAELAFLFLAFASSELLVYFHGLLTDAVSGGVAYSDSFLYSMTSQRLPSETLAEIIQERQAKEQDDGKQQ